MRKTGITHTIPRRRKADRQHSERSVDVVIVDMFSAYSDVCGCWCFVIVYQDDDGEQYVEYYKEGQ